MIVFLGQKLRFLLIFILVIIGISFIFFGSWTPNPTGSYGVVGMIDGRNVSMEEFQAALDETRIMQAFRTGRMLENGSSDANYLLGQTWSRMVALRAAKKGGIDTSDAEVINEIKNNPMLQNEQGVYQPELYQRFCIYYLNPQGVTNPDRFHEMVRNDITLNKFVLSMARTAVVRQEEVEEAFQDLFSNIQAWTISFPTQNASSKINPSKQDLEEFFKKNAKNYTSPEVRKIEAVVFQLSDVDKKLPEADYKKALRRLNEEAFYFTSLFLGAEDEKQKPASFREAADEKQLNVLEGTVLDPESPSSTPPGTSIFNQPLVRRAVFKLSQQEPVSDYIGIEHGFVVCNLVEIIPPKPLSFEEAQSKVRADFIQEYALESLEKQATSLKAELEQKLVAGVSWEKAVAELKQKTRKEPPFSIALGSGTANMEQGDILRTVVQKLKPGEISKFEPTPTGGVLVYLQEKAKPTEEVRASFFPKIRQQILRQRQMQLVDQWLIHEMTRPKNKLPSEVIKSLHEEA